MAYCCSISSSIITPLPSDTNIGGSFTPNEGQSLHFSQSLENLKHSSQVIVEQLLALIPRAFALGISLAVALLAVCVFALGLSLYCCVVVALKALGAAESKSG